MSRDDVRVTELKHSDYPVKTSKVRHFSISAERPVLWPTAHLTWVIRSPTYLLTDLHRDCILCLLVLQHFYYRLFYSLRVEVTFGM